MTTFRTQRLFHEQNRQEFRFTIQNQGATPTLPAFFDAANWRGKFFHRGCHGWLERIELFVRNTAGVAQNITVGLSNYPGGVERATLIVACPPGDNWCSANVRMQWQWDGLFAYVYVHGANTSLAFDLCTTSSELPDGYYSTTGLLAGPWTLDFTAIDPLSLNRRYHIRAYISQSVGDVPVTGHVSIVEVGPHLRVVITDDQGNISGVGFPQNYGEHVITINNAVNGPLDKQENFTEAITDATFDRYYYAIQLYMEHDLRGFLDPENSATVIIATAAADEVWRGTIQCLPCYKRSAIDSLTLRWIYVASLEFNMRRVARNVAHNVLIQNGTGLYFPALAGALPVAGEDFIQLVLYYNRIDTS